MGVGDKRVCRGGVSPKLPRAVTTAHITSVITASPSCTSGQLLHGTDDWIRFHRHKNALK